jgi:hypothetical protein
MPYGDCGDQAAGDEQVAGLGLAPFRQPDGGCRLENEYSFLVTRA